MPRFFIRGDEKYPVYDLLAEPYASGDTVIELSDAEIADFEEVMQRYDAWQERLQRADFR